MFRFWVSIIFLTIFVTLGCNAQDTSGLVGKWLLTSIYDGSSTQDLSGRADQRNFIEFNYSGGELKFTQSILAEDTATGNAQLLGQALILIGFPEGVSVPIDSMIYNREQGESSIQLKAGDQLVGSITNSGLTAVGVEQQWLIVHKCHDSLILQSGGYELQFSKETGSVYGISGFNASGKSISRGLVGVVGLILLAWLFSADRKSISWSLVGKGLLFQLILAVCILYLPPCQAALEWVARGFIKLTNYASEGTRFLFGVNGQEIQQPLLVFAITILPTIIFFSALMSILYYLGVIQKLVYVFALIMKKAMALSGAESLAAAGNVFLGQTESPLLIKPYLLGMTKSEVMCLMTGGMATAAGGALAAYVLLLGGADPIKQAYFTKHLLTASIISAPAAIVAAKILIPETESFKESMEISEERFGANLLEAITIGTGDGVRLAVNVGAMVLVFISLIALANGILGWIGDVSGINELLDQNTQYKELSFQMVLGYLCAPIAWLVGIDNSEILYIGELLGQKTILNEFVAYPRLGQMQAQGLLSERSVLICTYMLCGFANIASIGIQIGGIGALAPERKSLLAQLGVRSLLGGAIACLLTAVMVGMFV